MAINGKRRTRLGSRVTIAVEIPSGNRLPCDPFPDQHIIPETVRFD